MNGVYIRHPLAIKVVDRLSLVNLLPRYHRLPMIWAKPGYEKIVTNWDMVGNLWPGLEGIFFHRVNFFSSPACRGRSMSGEVAKTNAVYDGLSSRLVLW